MTNTRPPKCRHVAKDQPRAIVGEHYDTCTGSNCEGCWPCRENHCLTCGRTHTDTNCAACLNTAREDLTEIARLCGFPLLEEALIQGVDSEAAMLLAPVANPEAWSYRKLSAIMGRIDATWLEYATDEAHPLWVLSSIETEWREAWGHTLPQRQNVHEAADYISRMLHIVAGTLTTPDGDQGPEFAAAKRQLSDCRTYLENVLSEGERDERGAPCPRCGKGALVKSYGDTEADDRWVCRSRDCREWWTDEDYRAKVGAAYERHADALTASAIRRVYRISEGSVRGWASKGSVRKRGKDARGLQLYDVADVMAMRDGKETA